MKTKLQALYTPAGENLTDFPWQSYPRPQLRRRQWLCLNGLWSFSAAPAGQSGPERSIRVPFCPESLLSGIGETFPVGTVFHYSRSFSLPESFQGQRILLHFGAVDQVCRVYLNGEKAGEHRGGYLPFTLDITALLQPGENLLSLEVEDELLHSLPWGKQRRDRGGMWYTPVSGIWQTVWLEPVPEEYIRSLQLDFSADHVDLRIESSAASEAEVLFHGQCYVTKQGFLRLNVSEGHLWSPEDPYLYSFTLRCGEDTAESYFALRSIDVRPVNGIPRLCLNGKPYFFHGLLDQGYWSDGLYTPAVPELYEQDILRMKALGFNTLRKHIKIEPEQFYYDCDRLGMVVFQDMVNCSDYSFFRDTVLPTIGIGKLSDRAINRDPATRAAFLQHMEDTVQQLRSHPCILYWTIFNEGWGQFCAAAAYERLRRLDPTRIIDSTSGWFHQHKSDVDSLHIYFRPLHGGTLPLPTVLSEFGGYVYKLPDHSANREKTFGYKILKDRESYVSAVRSLYLEQVLPQVKKGLCAAIYTQVSDVEDETNGLLTYDRRCMKLQPEEMADIALLLRSAVLENA